ncbi:MAG: aldo/keto reductase [Ginsengibacter sp.]
MEVSTLGLGCMGMSSGYGKGADKKEMITLNHKAVEEGITFFDTAEGYGPFANEELVGEVLAPFKAKVIIGTKFCFAPSQNDVSKWTALDSRPEHMKQLPKHL